MSVMINPTERVATMSIILRIKATVASLEAVGYSPCCFLFILCEKIKLIEDYLLTVESMISIICYWKAVA